MPYEDLNENLNVTASTKTTQGDAAVAGKRWYVKAAKFEEKLFSL